MSHVLHKIKHEIEVNTTDFVFTSENNEVTVSGLEQPAIHSFFLGKGLEKAGVSKEILEKTRIFSTSGATAKNVRPLYGDKTPFFESSVSSGVTIPGKPAATLQSNPFGGAADIKQASLADAGNPNLATTAPKTDTAYTGTASQNRFLLEQSGQASQTSIVDAIKAGDIQGVSDSTKFGRSKYFSSLGGETGYTAWMKEKGLISSNS